MASTWDPNADGRVSHTPTFITSAAYLAEATLQWRRRASDPSDCLPVVVMQPLARREALGAAGGNSPTVRLSAPWGSRDVDESSGSATLRENGGGWFFCSQPRMEMETKCENVAWEAKQAGWLCCNLRWASFGGDFFLGGGFETNGHCRPTHLAG